MSSRILRTLFAAALVVPTVAVGALAGPPSILNMFQQKSTAVSEQNMTVQAENGPWMILAMTFSGDDGEAKALALAQELRRTITPEVYVHHKEYDTSQTLYDRGARESSNGRLVKVHGQYLHGRQERSYAVLVGNFTSVDDARADDLLQRVRTAYPKSLSDTAVPSTDKAKSSDDSTWLVAAARVFSWKKVNNEETKKKGPMGFAFVTRNPCLPDEFFTTNAVVDDFVLKLNNEIGDEKIKYSLLKCPGRYTVRVASFRGHTATHTADHKIDPNKQVSDQLDDAAMKAHTLTMALRKKNVEAYEFHDRYGSYVTIGSFDSLGAEGPDGKFSYHPGMNEILNEWCGYRMLPMKDPIMGTWKQVSSANSLEKIPFDIEGKPIPVPNASTSKLYQGSLLGKQRIN
ncbi:MAG: hypothetical protein U0892_00785 [Pirellulales bacterium]